MAAPSLDVDWDAVRAHAIVHGVRAAARHFGLGEDAVCQRSRRYGWLKQAGVAIVEQPLPASMQRTIVRNVRKPSEAASSAMQTLSRKSKLNLAIAVAKGAKSAKKMKGAEIIAKAANLKALADTGDKIHQWSGQATAPTLRLELIAGSVGSADQAELPAIDIEAELLPSNELKGIQGVDEETQDNSAR